MFNIQTMRRGIRTCPSLNGGILSYWKFNESSGDAADSVGGRTLTNNNSTAYAPALIANGGDLVAASNNYFSYASAVIPLSTDFTLSFWFQSSDTTSEEIMLVTQYAGGAGRFITELNRPSNLGKIGAFQGGAGGFGAVNSSDSFSTTSFNQYLLSRSGNTYQLWLNNRLQSEFSGSAAIEDTQYRIGEDLGAGTVNFTGRIDEMGVWSRALTAREISILWNGGAGRTYPF